MSNIVEELESKISEELQRSYFPMFESDARYVGNGIYNWMGIHSTDTRELFLMGIAELENIEYDGKGV